MAEITLKFIGKKLDEVLREQADFRDQLTVLTAICMRVESSISALTEEMRSWRCN